MRALTGPVSTTLDMMNMTEERKSNGAPRWLIFIGVPFLAAVWTELSVVVAGVVISGLPRYSQGESVTVSYRACLSVTYVAALLIPYLVTSMVTRTLWKRMFVLGTVLVAFLLVYYVFGGTDAINKAWRRGW